MGSKPWDTEYYDNEAEARKRATIKITRQIGILKQHMLVKWVKR